MTKMTDAFKKLFLGLGGDPKELAENNDVGDYILDLEDAIKGYVDEAVSGGDKVIVIEVSDNYTEVDSIHLQGSDIDITSPNDLSNYMKEGYKFILHSDGSPYSDSYIECTDLFDDPDDDQELGFSFHSPNYLFSTYTVYVRYYDESRIITTFTNQLSNFEDLYITGEITLDDGQLADIVCKRVIGNQYKIVIDRTTFDNDIYNYPLQRVIITNGSNQYDGVGYFVPFNGPTSHGKIFVTGINTTTNQLFKCSITRVWRNNQYIWDLEYFTTYNLTTT